MKGQLQNVCLMLSANHRTYLAVMRDEDFFQALGQRVATFRQQRGLTQMALAERLGVGQQALATYEKATRRLPSSMLIPLVNILGVSFEALLGVEPAKSRPGPVPKLQRQFDSISQLPKSEQRFFSTMIDRFLSEPDRQETVSSVEANA